MDVISLLRELTEAQGVSGQEDSLRPTAEKFFRPLCDEIKYDKLGNLIALKKGTAEGKEHIKIMLAAHMDEIGLVVTKIEEGGFLRFSTIGGFDARTLPGQKVIIHGRKDITGVIGSKSPHITEEKERKKAVEIDKLFIDTGYAQSELLEIVKVGDIISIERSIYELANGCVSGKALDDRAGVVALMYCLHKLQSLHHVPDVYAVATVQEEVGVRGAAVSAYNIAPDLSIAIDVCHGNLPGVSEFETQEIGAGPVIGLGPNFHPSIIARLKEVAKRARIPVQFDVSAGPTGTDARAIQIARGGIPTGLLSLPLRYMHTSVELLSCEDLKLTAELLAVFISTIDRVFVEGLTCF